MKFEEAFDKSLIAKLGEYRPESELLWNKIYGFTEGKQVGELLENFTDHGWRHISNVVNGMWALASGKTKKHFSPEEAYLLLSAGLYHDIAMHLSMARLKIVISNPKYTIGHRHATYFGDKPWNEEWDSYRLSLCELKSKDINAIFGTTDISEAEMLETADLDGTSPESKKVAGEFVRRNHARMAFDFAFYGLPSQVGVEERLLERSDLAILAGEIARSHGYSLKKWAKYYRTLYDIGFPTIAPSAIVQMGLLRISDYLEIGTNRTIKSIRTYRNLGNEISELEWDINEAVLSPKPHNGRLIFPVQPSKVNTVEKFLRIRSYFEGISNEFENTLALLSTSDNNGVPAKEVMNFIGAECDLENSENSEYYRFVPDDVRISISSNELVSLLVGPLYNYQSSFAVRELQQNAADAVDMLRECNIVDSLGKVFITDVDIETIYDSTLNTLTVRDRGCGMGLDTIMNRFLKVGGTLKFRNGIPQLKFDAGALRGRFGVGFLASFLLGRSVTVSTRDIRGTEPGYTFSISSLEDRPIEVRFNEHGLYGTEIVVHDFNVDAVKNLMANGLEWFRVDGVLQRIIIDNIEQKQSMKFPDRIHHMVPFRRISVEGSIVDYVPEGDIVCLNGVVLGQDRWKAGSRLSFNVWADTDSVDVNLQRTEFSLHSAIQAQIKLDSMAIFESYLMIAFGLPEFDEELLRRFWNIEGRDIVIVESRSRLGRKLNLWKRILGKEESIDEVVGKPEVKIFSVDEDGIFDNVIFHAVQKETEASIIRQALEESLYVKLFDRFKDELVDLADTQYRIVFGKRAKNKRSNYFHLLKEKFTVSVDSDLKVRWKSNCAYMEARRSEITYLRRSHGVGLWLDDFGWMDEKDPSY